MTSLPLRILFLLFLSLDVVRANISGMILACEKWALSRYPHIRGFLLDGEAEYYQGVSIQMEQGTEGITLQIYENGKSIKRVDLTEYDSREELHALFVEEGFQLKGEDELAAIMARKKDNLAMVKERALKRQEERIAQQEETERLKKAGALPNEEHTVHAEL